MATIESRSVFYGVNSNDSADSILLEATTEGLAKVELLDQLGYKVVEHNSRFFVADVEDPDTPDVALKGITTFEQALDRALKQLEWHVSEPIELIGGSLPGGMGYDDEQNGW